MLETRELCKTYKPKKGVPVLAVDHVSLRFPETGMVFLLGKSGSGKSTMLNLLGGLDQYDGGEIIIKGMSSKNFNQQRFDSYRNTYVGFIFQEYNVLEEFTVGANIALALELQGRKATDQELNAILHDVDLDGYGDRKPNELSGGQKQRVAIARALVKNPEIIMADEPTGALDSNTGRQVLDTLKKLSAKKLVVVVSHDREYAERYADRIIELADGKVVRDVEAAGEALEAETAQTPQIIFRSNTVEIPGGYHLTEEDRMQINNYIDSLHNGGLTLAPQTSQRKFRETDTSNIPVQDGSKFKLIQSKLPMRSAFKIGCSSLKHKRFRLVMTILLSVVAFGLFGMVDTFGSYNHIRACTSSLMDSNLDYVSVQKALRMDSGISEYWSTYGHQLSEQDLKDIKSESGIDVTGIFRLPTYDMGFGAQYDSTVELTKGEFPVNLGRLYGYAQITQSDMENMGYSLVAGKLPTGTGKEIAISKVVCETFIKAGYTDETLKEDFYQTEGQDDASTMDGSSSKEQVSLQKPGQEQDEKKINYVKIESEKDMIGKVLRLDSVDYTICGVVDTKLDLNRYNSLTTETDQMSTAQMVLNYMLSQELSCATQSSLSGMAMLSPEAFKSLVDSSPRVHQSDIGDISLYCYNEGNGSDIDIFSRQYTTLNKVPAGDIVWVDGEKTSLAENEFILSPSCIHDDGIVSVRYSNSGDNENELQKLTGEDAKKLAGKLSGLQGNLWMYNAHDGDRELKDVKIVGFIQNGSTYDQTIVVSDELCSLIVSDIDGVFESAVGSMPKTEEGVEAFVRYCYREGTPVRYALQNAVTYELDTIDEVLKVASKVFFYIGIGFAIFAALLMANFISTSITYKKQEIGILRAIGSRSNDVFRIFFSESFVIAMINFVISGILCVVGVSVINYVARVNGGILVTLLHFGPRQIGLLFLICVGIAAVASFIPVMRIASKRPIDAIRNR